MLNAAILKLSVYFEDCIFAQEVLVAFDLSERFAYCLLDGWLNGCLQLGNAGVKLVEVVRQDSCTCMGAIGIKQAKSWWGSDDRKQVIEVLAIDFIVNGWTWSLDVILPVRVFEADWVGIERTLESEAVTLLCDALHTKLRISYTWLEIGLFLLHISIND